MFVLHLVLIFGLGNSNSKPLIPVALTSEYHNIAACKAAAEAIQRAAGQAAQLVTCTSKG